MANEPITREEILLNAVATGEQANIKPITREEMYLAKLGGADVTPPTPITRKEQFLQKAIENGGNTGGDEGWIGDGNTHIWISLAEGRTSPMLGVCPNGTVTVDWGDGTTPDVLTGTSLTTVKWTPNHEYAKAGDYVITLNVDGEMGFGGQKGNANGSYMLRYAQTEDNRNAAYLNALRKIEISSGVTAIGDYAFYGCRGLSSIVIPDGVTYIGESAFDSCSSLSSIVIPDGVTRVEKYAFYSCSSLSSIVIPDGVTYIDDGAFYGCYSLKSIIIPDGVTTIGSNAFSYCHNLQSIVIPDGVTSIYPNAFSNCSSLSSIIIPDGVTYIGNSAFSYCYSSRHYNFTRHTAVPTLSGTNAFNNIPADCEILVPAALYDEWIAATNWATYASYIKAV